MAKHGVSDICSTARSWALAAVILISLQVSSAQRVRVDAEVRAFAKESVLLRCMFVTPGNTKLTQVSWIKEATEGTERINIAVFHPQYGESFPNSDFKGRVKFTQGSLDNPSIEISNLRMADEGKYTCEYATYPSGNEQGTTNLLMLAKPKNSAQHLTVTEGKAAVVVARCEAAEGKPAAAITWESDVAGGKANTTQVQQADGTVTVKSEYWLTPTPSHNNRDVKCVVTQTTQDKPQLFPMKLSIQYPPKVSIVGYDDNWYMGRTDAVLVCQHDANPLPTTVDWTVASGALPDAVEVSGDRLLVKKVDDSVNTTFVCEVKNTLGSAKSQLTAVVIESSEDPSNAGVLVGAILGSLLALLLVAALVGVLVTRSRRQQQHRSYPGDGEAGTYGNKVRLFGMGGNSGGGNGGKASKNGGNNNNGPVYSYREGEPDALDEKPNDPRAGCRGDSPTPHHILLNERDEAERRKLEAMEDSQEEYEEEEDEEEEANRYDGYGYHNPHHHQQAPHAQPALPNRDGQIGYLDDDMESQRDGSVISRTAIYV
ncbi:PVR cell adhesion molecule related 2 like isoform X1 [Alosa sapidissima]|uniref:PVR cell adhesion molecule related 2 like isoform X1 n=1 Tax=Alosa sapidissima TaxID=34773 RepID=UPI001C0A3187|nr:PVR cell adhesion molecule related 2 like isoform X1 [Alosa sapidissima]